MYLLLRGGVSVLVLLLHLVAALHQQCAGGGDGEHQRPTQGQVVGQHADLDVSSRHQKGGSYDQDQGNDGDSNVGRNVFLGNILLEKNCIWFIFFWIFLVL